MSDSLWSHRWQPTRLLCSWDSPGRNTGVGCHFLPQFMHACKVASVMSDSVWPYGQQPIRLLCPQASPGKKTGVGCHFLLQMQNAFINIFEINKIKHLWKWWMKIFRLLHRSLCLKEIMAANIEKYCWKLYYHSLTEGTTSLIWQQTAKIFSRLAKTAKILGRVKTILRKTRNLI